MCYSGVCAFEEYYGDCRISPNIINQIGFPCCEEGLKEDYIKEYRIKMEEIQQKETIPWQQYTASAPENTLTGI